MQKSDRLSLRATPAQKLVFEAAARLRAQTVTAFVLQSAWENAQRILADQHNFPLSEDVWDAFNAALDQPPVDTSRLRAFLSTPSVLEK